MINTVCGPVKLSDLGRTLIHEHIICSGSEFQRAFPGYLRREMVLDIAAAKLKYAAQKYHIRTVVDGTPLILGRDLELLQEVSRRSGVNIIASSGFYFYSSFPLTSVAPETLAAFLVDEIVSGAIRPAMLKCASETQEFTPSVKNSLKVIAMVQRATGLPVYCHSNSWQESGIAIQDFLTEEGVPPEKMIIGHISGSNNIGYAVKVLEHGSFVSVDRINSHNGSFAAELVRRGYEDRIFLSHDHICCRDNILQDPPVSQNEPLGLDTVHGTILPEMRDLGVSETALRKITAENIICLYQGKKI